MLRTARKAALPGMTFCIPFVLSVTLVHATESSLEPINKQLLPPGDKLPIVGSAPVPGSSQSTTAETVQSQPLESKPKPKLEPKPKPLTISLSSVSPKQGDTVKVTVWNLTSSPKEISFNGNKVKLFPGKSQNSWSCLLGIPVTIKPGKYKITYGDTTTKQITVLNAKFPTRYLRLPKKKNNFKASPGEKETIRKAKKTLSDQKLWQGKFKRPVRKGRISSVFGIRRVVNGKLLKDYFHSGTDFAAPRGTPIYAPAPGKVIVARKGWRLHGNSICIDHGQGVISIYIHMNSISVKEGQTVKTGQRVGAVGSTGRASGPHLHFGIYVNNEATNPMNWFVKEF